MIFLYNQIQACIFTNILYAKHERFIIKGYSDKFFLIFFTQFPFYFYAIWNKHLKNKSGSCIDPILGLSIVWL